MEKLELAQLVVITASVSSLLRFSVFDMFFVELRICVSTFELSQPYCPIYSTSCTDCADSLITEDAVVEPLEFGKLEMCVFASVLFLDLESPLSFD